MICPKCNTENNDNEKFCKNCGLQLNTTKVCPNCNSVNKPDAKFCLKCGTELSPAKTFKKDIIANNAKSSFFGTYKIPIICALIIILAIGAVTGVTIFSNGNGDNGFKSIIPLSNDTFDNSNSDNYGLNHDDETNQSDDKNLSENKTKNATSGKNLTDSNSNKTVDKDKKTNSTKIYTEKTTDKNNKSDANKSNANKSNSEKSDKLDSNKFVSSKNTSSNSNNDLNKSISSNKNNKNKKSSQIIPGFDDDEDENDADLDLDDVNDTDSDYSNGTDSDDEDNGLNESDVGGEDMGFDSIDMKDVPNLAQEASSRQFKFSSITYNGNEFSDAQCIDIFAEYIINVNNGMDSPIEIDSVSKASNPSGEDESQEISKSDYLSIANRVHSWIDKNDQVPNYVGVKTIGQADLSPDKMLELFGVVILSYSISEELPESVDI